MLSLSIEIQDLFFFLLKYAISFRSLPNIEEAWKLPIPAELTTRTVRLVQQVRIWPFFASKYHNANTNEIQCVETCVLY